MLLKELYVGSPFAIRRWGKHRFSAPYELENAGARQDGRLGSNPDLPHAHSSAKVTSACAVLPPLRRPKYEISMIVNNFSPTHFCDI